MPSVVHSNTSLRNRIVGHRRVRAGDLKHHPLNWREHPKGQRQALQAIIQEVGLARSLLCYIADGDKHTERPPFTLIDGHLRADMHPEEELEIEIVDVNDQEARKLLLSLDPLVGLGKPNHEMLRNLNAITQTEDKYLKDLWTKVAGSQKIVNEEISAKRVLENQYLVLITCDNEDQQLDLLKEFKERALDVKAVIG